MDLLPWKPYGSLEDKRLRQIALWWKIEDSTEMPLFYCLMGGGFLGISAGIVMLNLLVLVIGVASIGFIIPLRYILWDVRGRLISKWFQRKRELGEE